MSTTDQPHAPASERHDVPASRQARCDSCGKMASSRADLPFFRDLSAGQTDDICCRCGVIALAHIRKAQGLSYTLPHTCDSFDPMTGGLPVDGYYCGCQGWN